MLQSLQWNGASFQLFPGTAGARLRALAAPVLLVGGDAPTRRRLAEALHAQGPQMEGELRVLDGSATPAGGDPAVSPFPFEGTLLIEHPELLSRACQRQLLRWMERECRGAGRTRFLAGLSGSPEELMDHPGLLPGLLDTLDKWRIEILEDSRIPQPARPGGVA